MCAGGDARPCVPPCTHVRPSPQSLVNTTGRPWWPLAAVVPSLLERCISNFVWVHLTRLGSPVLGLLGLSCYSLDLVGLNLLAFVLKLSLKHSNLQSKLNKAKTECNRRNICINRKLMQINTKF